RDDARDPRRRRRLSSRPWAPATAREGANVSRVTRSVAAAVVALTLLAPREAGADAREVSARVVEAWEAAGARVTVLSPRFVFDDETVTIPLPAEGASA